ncbi:unnamed protein product [Rhizophagus irregularis]|nr:unnamed protein product [Rhizophagus irregularis]CAB5197578.1 unnamed protein product [Rhizophagus irregularis]
MWVVWVSKARRKQIRRLQNTVQDVKKAQIRKLQNTVQDVKKAQIRKLQNTVQDVLCRSLYLVLSFHLDYHLRRLKLENYRTLFRMLTRLKLEDYRTLFRMVFVPCSYCTRQTTCDIVDVLSFANHPSLFYFNVADDHNNKIVNPDEAGPQEYGSSRSSLFFFTYFFHTNSVFPGTLYYEISINRFIIFFFLEHKL